MLARCATCNKMFIKRSNESECPGCIVSGPTKDLPPVAPRREREIPDLREGRDRTSPGRGRNDAAAHASRSLPIRLISGVLLIAAGTALTALRNKAPYLTAIGPITAFAGVFLILAAIYAGGRAKTIRKRPGASED